MSDDRSFSIGPEEPVIVLNEESLTSAHLFRYDDDAILDKRGTVSVHCRICHEDSSHEELIDPCECSGTLAMIHASCLERWLSTSNTECCEICKHDFYVRRTDKTFFKSLWEWWKSRSGHGARGIASDVLCLLVMTPLCVAATYLCGVGAKVYTRLGFWEGTGLAVICVLLVATYCLWLTVTLRFHWKSWQDWRLKNPDFKLLIKHRSDEERMISKTKTRILNNRENNGRAIPTDSDSSMNRCASWCGMYFNNSRDPYFTVQQTSFA